MHSSLLTSQEALRLTEVKVASVVLTVGEAPSQTGQAFSVSRHEYTNVVQSC